MKRGKFLITAVPGSATVLAGLPPLISYSNTALSAMKITRVRYYSAPGYTKPLSRCHMELGGGAPEKPAYFNEDYFLFKNGKLFPNPAPGLRMKFNPKKAAFVMEVTVKKKFHTQFFEAPMGPFITGNPP